MEERLPAPMNEQRLKIRKKVDCGLLRKLLAARNVPFAEVTDRQPFIIKIGLDTEYEVHDLGRAGAKIFIRYEHPLIKSILADWLQQCDATAPESFYEWHNSLSPSIIKGIKGQWLVDLAGIHAAPFSLGKHVWVLLCSENVHETITAQLAGKPHKSMVIGEFIRCEEFSVDGEDPVDTMVYQWTNENGVELCVTVSSAPAMTLLAFWMFAKGMPVTFNICLKSRT